MKKLYSLWDVYKYPLVLLFIAAGLKGFGNLCLDPLVTGLIPGEYGWLNNIWSSFIYIGTFLERMFPIFFLVRYISRRFEDGFPVMTALVAYVLFNVVTMFYGPYNLPIYQYNTTLGMSWLGEYGNIAMMKYPLFLGVLGALVIGWIVSFTYKRSRKRFAYGFLGFMNNDVYSMMNALILTAAAGFAFAYGWKYALTGLQQVLDYIAADIYNPSNLFFYGLTEQILSVLGLQDLIREPFWFGSLGGTWMDNFGKSYSGDVTLWTTFVRMNMSSIRYGRFITPYYIANLFAVPGFFAAIYSLTTDKLKRRRYTGLLILAILVSIFSGCVWPLNIFLVLTAPAVFFSHTVFLCVLYALLPQINVMIGYSYTGTVADALPGNLMSLIPYITNANYAGIVLKTALIGLGYFFVYFFLTRLYYRRISGDFLDSRKDENYTNQVIEALGGTANIRFVNSTFDAITVYLYDPSKLNSSHLVELGAYRVLNTRAGIELQFGPRSSNLRIRLTKAVEKYLEEQRAKPVVVSSDIKL
ncbi:MAG: hypothetical protein IIU06_06990 [Erysipelotrichales bacterium]|nr:hypothetical protein [Erysipelotrichales bacterium]